MKESIRKAWDRYIRFVDRQGFPIIVAVCIGVITATVLLTEHNRDPYAAPTPPPVEPISAAQLLQQSLANAATATPAPSPTHTKWAAPLDHVEILRAYNAESMARNDSGIWTVHDAVDLKSSAGAEVYAIGDGEVIDAGNDLLRGAWLSIRHDDSVVAHYAGLTLLNDYIPGDTVRRGDNIGFIGNKMLDEISLGPHLHLRITKDGKAADPCMLW